VSPTIFYCCYGEELALFVKDARETARQIRRKRIAVTHAVFFRISLDLD
jgi:hypothetical protein